VYSCCLGSPPVTTPCMVSAVTEVPPLSWRLSIVV
jgi:hypothetical protein